MVGLKNHRRVYFIEKKFQVSFILKFCALVIIGALLTSALMYFLSQKSTTVVFEHSRALVKSTADFLLPLLLQTIVATSLIVATATIALTLFISHKIAGPLYRLKKELSTIEVGNLTSDFSLRDGDQLQDVAKSMSAMIKGLRDRISDLKKDWYSFKENWQVLESRGFLPNAKQNIESLKNTMIQIEKNLDYFKIHK